MYDFFSKVCFVFGNHTCIVFAPKYFSRRSLCVICIWHYQNGDLFIWHPDTPICWEEPIYFCWGGREGTDCSCVRNVSADNNSFRCQYIDHYFFNSSDRKAINVKRKNKCLLLKHYAMNKCILLKHYAMKKCLLLKHYAMNKCLLLKHYAMNKCLLLKHYAMKKCILLKHYAMNKCLLLKHYAMEKMSIA